MLANTKLACTSRVYVKIFTIIFLFRIVIDLLASMRNCFLRIFFGFSHKAHEAMVNSQNRHRSLAVVQIVLEHNSIS